MKQKRLKNRHTKVTDSLRNIRRFSLPRGWVLQTGILLLQLQAGSFAVKNRDKIIAFARLKRKQAKSAAPHKRWRAKKKLWQQPPYTQAEAYGRRLVFQAYREALANGLIPIQAERIARIASILFLEKEYCGRTVRNIVALIESRGGLRAPIEAFATERSCPHSRQRKLKKAVQRV
jgi:hypothetical protein